MIEKLLNPVASDIFFIIKAKPIGKFKIIVISLVSERVFINLWFKITFRRCFGKNGTFFMLITCILTVS